MFSAHPCCACKFTSPCLIGLECVLSNKMNCDRVDGHPGWGDSHMKQMGMLVVSLRDVNFGFWYCLGCSEQDANILCCWPRSCLGLREETQNYAKRNRSQIFLRYIGKKLLLDNSIRCLCLYVIKTHCMSYLCGLF